jgi:predicted GIY-YIG superfamily endonuclease
MWLDDQRTALYRLYGETDELLYIGISHQPQVRFEQHSKAKEWWSRVARREIEWFADRPTAAQAEEVAVRTEDPEFNNIYSPRIDRRMVRDALAEDGIQETSVSLARPKLAELIEMAVHARPVALVSRKKRVAVIVGMDFYERALEALGEERVLVEKPADSD